jgi:hypothetical protein
VAQLDHDVLDALRTALIPKSSGSQWGGDGDAKSRNKRKVRTAALPEAAYTLGTLGPVDDQLKAELLWLEASPAGDYPKLRKKTLFIAEIAQLEVLRFSLERVIRCSIDQYVYKQAVLLEQDFVGRSVKIALFPRGRDGKRHVMDGTLQTRTITYNGPRTIAIDRPLETVGFDMVAAFNDASFGRKT